MRRFKDERIKKGITQKELADFLQVSQQSISKYENGMREPDYETLIKMASFYDVSVDYLLGLTNVNNTHKHSQQNLDKKFQRVINYYNRLNIENQDYILGEMIRLYRQQEENVDRKKDTG